MFVIWYTDLDTFAKHIPATATVYHSILHTTSGSSPYSISRTTALHLRAIDITAPKEILHALAISAGVSEFLNGHTEPLDSERWERIQNRVEALEDFALRSLEAYGYDCIEAIPAVPSDIEYLYTGRPADFVDPPLPASLPVF